jgi:hypothetical protein
MRRFLALLSVVSVLGFSCFSTGVLAADNDRSVRHADQSNYKVTKVEHQRATRHCWHFKSKDGKRHRKCGRK